MRTMVLFFAALALGGCNVLTTQTPLFGPEDAGAPDLRRGVWRIEDPDCAFDPGASTASWPECAQWFYVDHGKFHMPDDSAGVVDDDGAPYLVTGGVPRVWQLVTRNKAAGSTPERTVVYYFGFEALTSAYDGVDAFRFWTALCGPPPPKGQDADGDGQTDYTTTQPFAGVTLTGDGGCTTDNATALRGAVAGSEAFETKPAVARWLRYSYP